MMFRSSVQTQAPWTEPSETVVHNNPFPFQLLLLVLVQ